MWRPPREERGCRSSVLPVRALLVKEKHSHIPRREDLEAYTMIGRVGEAMWKLLLVHEIGPLLAHSNPGSYRKMTLGSGAPVFPAMRRVEKRVDDAKLTKTIWYKQIKPNSHIQSEKHKDVITAHDSSCIRKEPHRRCEQNPEDKSSPCRCGGLIIQPASISLSNVKPPGVSAMHLTHT